jgi:hypothetical protein
MDRARLPARIAAAGLLLACAALPGCVERRIFITSDPPGALVHMNDVEVGRTPLEVDFVYFGKYDIRVEKDGYETLLTSAGVNLNVHDYPGVDLVAEAWPHRFKSHARWHFTLEEATTDPDELIARAATLRRQLSGAPAAPAPAGESAPAQEPIVIDELSEFERRDREPLPPPEEPLPEPPSRR